MAKKSKDEGKSESIASTIGDIAGKVINAVASAGEMKRKVSEKVRDAKKNVVSGLMFLVGSVFILISVVLLLKEFYDVSYGISCIALGALFILIGLFNKPRK